MGDRDWLILEAGSREVGWMEVLKMRKAFPLSGKITLDDEFGKSDTFRWRNVSGVYDVDRGQRAQVKTAAVIRRNGKVLVKAPRDWGGGEHVYENDNWRHVEGDQ